MNSLKKMLNWFLPHICILCGARSLRQQDLCQRCYNELPILTYCCIRCAMPLSGNYLCGYCLQQPFPVNVTYALFVYELPITQLILELKFNQKLVNARLLGELMAEKILQKWYRNKSLPDSIVPVPLHPIRLKERGFNQALEIARPIANTLKIPIHATACQRVIHTAAQATLPAAKREQNIKNAFTVTEDFCNQHIAVIDDVITTGQTTREFCQTLKSRGADTIDVWCCARSAKVGCYSHTQEK